MPALPPASYGHGGPTCFDKMKMGFTIGFCVGLASGALFGGFSALRLVNRNGDCFPRCCVSDSGLILERDVLEFDFYILNIIKCISAVWARNQFFSV